MTEFYLIAIAGLGIALALIITIILILAAVGFLWSLFRGDFL